MPEAAQLTRSLHDVALYIEPDTESLAGVVPGSTRDSCEAAQPPRDLFLAAAARFEPENPDVPLALDVHFTLQKATAGEEDPDFVRCPTADRRR